VDECCTKLGTIGLKLKMEKDVFYTDETIKAIVEVDTNDCKVIVKSVDIKLMQKTIFKKH